MAEEKYKVMFLDFDANNTEKAKEYIK
jgi:hypothetical protein